MPNHPPFRKEINRSISHLLRMVHMARDLQNVANLVESNYPLLDYDVVGFTTNKTSSHSLNELSQATVDILDQIG